MNSETIKTLREELGKIKFKRKEFSCLNFPNVYDEKSNDGLLKSPSFFPYGTGLFSDLKKNEERKMDVFVFGQDFGKSNYYENHIGHNEKSESTFTGLLNILKYAGIEEKKLKRCFFTNCCMGLREVDSKMYGSLKKYFIQKKVEWDDYFKLNSDFFETQLKIDGVKKVVLLGKQPSLFAGEKCQIDSWKKNSVKVSELVKLGFATSNNFPSIKFYVIPHPCMWNSNKRHYEKSSIKEMLNEIFNKE